MNELVIILVFRGFINDNHVGTHKTDIIGDVWTMKHMHSSWSCKHCVEYSVLNFYDLYDWGRLECNAENVFPQPLTS